jgi:predicted dithiol-disulfide oxidoreductase (DUF899 family)
MEDTNAADDRWALPAVVTPEEWQQARDALLVKEKRATRALDALAAERRRLPVVEFSAGYGFDGPHGSVDLLGLFAGRRQLVVYHFMFEPGDEHVCAGCSAVADSVGPLAHLHARDTSFALTSIAPPAELEAFKARMGWTVPWYSCRDRRFNEDCGTGTGFGLSVFLRDGERVFRSYFTSGRGVDRLRFDLNVLDHTPLGRQETWEDSPAGWPQTPAYWWRLHDEYPANDHTAAA